MVGKLVACRTRPHTFISFTSLHHFVHVAAAHTMPPRKRARISQATSPAESRTSPAPATSEPSPAKTDEAVINDPWTDDEEIALFKGLMHWKPTGIHKHFRLLALHAWLLENNYIHPRNLHTKPAGIWAKLNTLYDLPALDAREDARQLPPIENPLLSEDAEKKSRRSKRGKRSEEEEEEPVDDDADVYSEAANKIDEEEFELPPESGFEEEMWKRRLPRNKADANEDGDSEAELPELNMAEDHPVRFVPSFSIEPSETATPGSRKGRTGSGSTRKGPTRRSARQAESTADEEENHEEEDGGGVAEGEGEDEEGEHEEEQEGSGDEEADEEETPAPRSTRTSKGARGKGSARGKPRGRTRK